MFSVFGNEHILIGVSRRSRKLTTEDSSSLNVEGDRNGVASTTGGAAGRGKNETLSTPAAERLACPSLERSDGRSVGPSEVDSRERRTRVAVELLGEATV
jgi:hypothetical protein